MSKSHAWHSNSVLGTKRLLAFHGDIAASRAHIPRVVAGQVPNAERPPQLEEDHTVPMNSSAQMLERPQGSTSAGQPPAEHMVWIPGGTFLMGSNDHYSEEAPAHGVTVNGFWMDQYAVTNADFQRFTEATSYVTLAERPANPADYPGAKSELLEPSAVVFRKGTGPVDLRNPLNWWTYVRGADWRHPRGPGSSLKDLWQHPVVHVAYEDVLAYARWTGKALPTEAEWEFAARGGLEGAEYVWGSDFMPGGRPMCNNWQGEFPWQNDLIDGYEWTAPVGSFAPNGYGLYEMAGNIWEWTTDWFQEHSRIKQACCTLANPRGGEAEESYQANMPHIRIPRKVIKGGSFLSAPNYCRRYRPSARMAQPVDTAICHLGFRCVGRTASGWWRRET